MSSTSFLGRSSRVLGLLLPLWTVHAGCGSDPSAGSHVDPAERDAEAREPAASALDAATVAGGRNDAATHVAPNADAGEAQADASTTMTDASSTMQADAASRPLDAGTGSAHVFKVDSKAEWTASAFQVEAGRCYTIEAKIDDQWLDLDVPSDFSGWIDKSDPRFALFSPFRRVAQADIGFYQFATCVDKKLDQCFPVGTTSSVCAKSSGELFFFVNDAPGFESNNVGTATVSIRAQ